MTRWRTAALAGLVLAVLGLAVAGLVRAAAPSSPPSLHSRADAVAATLRCPTCNGLSIKDSTSVLAQGSRAIIEQQLAEGRTPDQVRQYFVDRYGPSVLLEPAPSGPGLLAWILPGVAVLGAGLLAWRWTRRGRPAAAEVVDADASAALTAYREGELDPDDTPSGEALREALLARQALDESPDEEAPEAELARRADRRLAAAYRRYRSRPAAVPAGCGGPPVARRAVLLASGAALLVAAGAGVFVTVRSAVPPGSGGGQAVAAATTPAPAVPSPPPGWTGGMPRTAEDWVSLGRAYDKAHQLPQAVAAYDMALRLQPGDDGITLLRADVQVRSGDAAQALPDLRQLRDRHPDNPDVLLVLGLAENRTGSADADATLRRFLQLAPDSPAAPGVRTLLGIG